MDSAEHATRRKVLRVMASALPSSALFPYVSWGRDEVLPAWPEDRAVSEGVLRIVLRVPDGHKVPSSAQVLVKIQDKWVEVPRVRSELIYEQKLKTGQAYGIRLVAPRYMTIERTVSVDRALVAAQVWLVPDGWPFYFARQVEIPVKPQPRLAGVALASRVASPDDVGRLLAEADKAGFNRVTRDPDTGLELDDVNGSVLYFEPKRPDVLIFSFAREGDHAYPGRVPPEPVQQLRRIFADYKGRVGSPTTLRSGGVRIVDNQYLIRLAKPVVADDVQRFAAELGARVLRETGPDGGYWLIEFADLQNLGRHLDVIARHVKSGELASGEPNLLFQLQPHGPKVQPLGPKGPGPFDKGPVRRVLCLLSSDHDPYEQCQDNLSRQQVKDAWCYIAQHFGNDQRYGSPSVLVATLDQGITFDSASKSSTHPDVDPDRVGFCYLVEDRMPCTGAPAVIDHGMGTYGIISAKPDNERGVTGIAPNATHVALRYESIWNTALLSETLLWIAGVPDSTPSAANDTTDLAPLPPAPAPGAHIISCSQGTDGVVPDSFSIIDDTLNKLVCSGRGGRGTVLIFSAGNNNQPLETQDQLATHPSTIGVANTEVRDGKEVRQLRPPDPNLAPYGSNFSDWIELCANGQGAPSLMANGNAPSTAQCGGGTPDTGVYLHGGTSAAAAMVAGAAALILSVNPDLNWKQVREILCRSASKIDCDNCDADGKWVWVGNGSAPPTSCDKACPHLSPGLDWFSKWYGFGRLDVYAAVKLAHETTPVALVC